METKDTNSVDLTEMIGELVAEHEKNAARNIEIDEQLTAIRNILQKVQKKNTRPSDPGSTELPRGSVRLARPTKWAEAVTEHESEDDPDESNETGTDTETPQQTRRQPSVDPRDRIIHLLSAKGQKLNVSQIAKSIRVRRDECLHLLYKMHGAGLLVMDESVVPPLFLLPPEQTETKTASADTATPQTPEGENNAAT